MTDAPADDRITAQQALRLLNSRPNCRVGQARFYKLLRSGEIPSQRVRVIHYSHYYLSAVGLSAWAEKMEEGGE